MILLPFAYTVKDQLLLLLSKTQCNQHAVLSYLFFSFLLIKQTILILCLKSVTVRIPYRFIFQI